MATFKTCVKSRRKDGFYVVYIRITHQKKIAYMPTGKMVSDKGLSKGEVIDPYVLQYCSNKIVDYVNRLNKLDIDQWDVQEIANFLKSENDDICFSDYARKYIDHMMAKGQIRNARNYELALGHMERFAGTNKIKFSHMTSVFVNKWILSMEHTKRAKEMYPICMRQIFKSAMLEMNDYDTGIINIKTNPWVKVQIPQADRPRKLAISPEECRRFFSYPLPESKMKHPLPELGRDVAVMVLCLAGINTIDLYEMKKEDYHGGILHYQRAKTKNSRSDGAYIEMRVPPILLPLFERYANTNSFDGHLFNFYQRHSSSDSFSANVNIGIRKICQAMGLEKEQYYCVYTFRHTWGTVAQNDCQATISEVAFAMNHSAGHKVTRGYLKLDFSPAWELNEKVIDFIFFSDKPSKEDSNDENTQFRLSYRFLARGTAYLQGKTIAEIQDTGFNNAEEVIKRLIDRLPDDIPNRSIVMFKIENVDKGQFIVVQKMKGRGF